MADFTNFESHYTSFPCRDDSKVHKPPSDQLDQFTHYVIDEGKCKSLYMIKAEDDMAESPQTLEAVTAETAELEKLMAEAAELEAALLEMRESIKPPDPEDPIYQILANNEPDHSTLYSDKDCTNKVQMSGTDDTVYGMDADKDYYGFIVTPTGNRCEKRIKESLDPTLYTSCGWLPFGWGKTEDEKFSMCYTMNEKKICFDNVSNLIQLGSCQAYNAGYVETETVTRFDCGVDSEPSISMLPLPPFYSDSLCREEIASKVLHKLPEDFYIKSGVGYNGEVGCEKFSKDEMPPLYKECGWLPFGWSKQEADSKLYSMCSTNANGDKFCLNNLRNTGDFGVCAMVSSLTDEYKAGGELDCQKGSPVSPHAPS